MESLVEASEITGEGEGCSSTESGWTLYLASPLQDDGNVHDVDDDDDDDGEVDSNVSAGFHDSNGESRAEEDDSLASDASTGNIEKNGTAILDDHVNRLHHGVYHSTDDGYSDHSSNVKERVKKMERRKGRCFGGLFKSNGSSSTRSSKNWKTKLSW